MSEKKSGSGCLLIGIVWTVLVLILGVAYKFFVQPLFQEKEESELRQATGSASQYNDEVILAADSFSGYAILRSDALRDDLKSRGIRLTIQDDQADYSARLSALESGKTHMAVYTIDSLVVAGARTGGVPPVSIVLVIDETKGGDAIVAHGDAVGSLHELDDPAARFVLTPNSPSEFLARVVIAHFNLPNLPDDWMEKADGAADVRQKFTKATRERKRAFVLWEPEVSRALKTSGAKVLLDSSKLKGYVVDVLVAQRQFLRDRPDLVRSVLEAYCRAAYGYRQKTDGMVSLVQKDDGNLNEEEARSIVKGIQWKNTLENYTHFGLTTPTTGALPNLEDMIGNIIDVLVKTEALDRDPLKDQHTSLFFNGILSEMKADNFHPSKKASMIEGLGPGTADLQAVNTEMELISLNEDQWARLRPVGELDVAPISFRRGSSRILSSGEHELKNLKWKLDSFPQFYLRVIGRARAEGDPEANRKLAQDRASSVGRFLEGLGFNSNRVRTEASPSTARSGAAQSVAFEVCQPNY